MKVEPLLDVKALKDSPAEIIERLAEAEAKDLYREALKVQMDLNINEFLHYL